MRSLPAVVSRRIVRPWMAATPAQAIPASMAPRAASIATMVWYMLAPPSAWSIPRAMAEWVSQPATVAQMAISSQRITAPGDQGKPKPPTKSCHSILGRRRFFFAAPRLPPRPAISAAVSIPPEADDPCGRASSSCRSYRSSRLPPRLVRLGHLDLAFAEGAGHRPPGPVFADLQVERHSRDIRRRIISTGVGIRLGLVASSCRPWTRPALESPASDLAGESELSAFGSAAPISLMVKPIMGPSAWNAAEGSVKCRNFTFFWSGPGR